MKNLSALNFKPNLTYMPAVGMGLVLAVVFSLVIFVLASVLVSYTPVPETALPYITYITSILSIFLGSLFAITRVKYKGWMIGGATGILYVLFVLGLGLVLGGEAPLLTGLLLKLFIGFVFGAVSGIIGMNL